MKAIPATGTTYALVLLIHGRLAKAMLKRISSAAAHALICPAKMAAVVRTGDS